MNNSVRNGHGKIIGFRCFYCGGIYESMWGETCNGCRKKNELSNQLHAEIRRLTAEVAKLKKGGEDEA